MAQRRLTIDIPESRIALHNLLEVLLQYKLISKEKAKTLEQEETAKKPVNRWAKVAEEMSTQGYLKGIGEELLESTREFRDDFEIRNPFEKSTK